MIVGTRNVRTCSRDGHVLTGSITDRLPIDSVLPALRAALDRGPCAVLHAPPGAGKTTRVPLALLDAGWLHGARVIMLEPRRLAARAAAAYMARLLGESVGDTVGYRVRLDTRVSARTRIEIVTEGVLTRMLQDDPALEGVGVVIFDEFHERSIHADTGLALALQSRQLLRPDLRLLVMSATLDVDAVARVLGDAPILRSEGRAHPVTTVYLPRRADGHIEAAVAGAVLRAHERHEGDILVFLPGAAEIRRTASRLAEAALPRTTHVAQLYGDLPQTEQDRAIAPSPSGLRKIVLATAIAETSLTIEGVRVVVDSGLMRVPRFSPRTGMPRLATVPVTRASAEQRCGRAGRLGPGICYRMWTEAEHSALLAHRPPEILDADLAPLALELAAWGVADPAELSWIDAPPDAAFRQARELLRELEALAANGTITAHGRALSRLALHPRLAHMLLRAESLHATGLACELAALIGERDVLRAHDGAADPDIRLRLPLVRGAGTAPPGHTVDHAALRRVRAEARHWQQRLRAGSGDRASDDETAGLLVALAYPDRIGVQRGARGRFLLRNGSGAAVEAAYALAGAEMIAAAALGGHGREVRIFLAAPVTRALVESHFATQIEDRVSVEFNETNVAVRAVSSRALGAIVLSERPARDLDDQAILHALLDAVRRRGLDVLPWTDRARAVRDRLAFLHRVDPEWPDVSDDALLLSLEQWLAPWLRDARRADVLRSIDLGEALLAHAGWQRRADLDRLAPTHVRVPSGSNIAIDYADPSAPVLAVRIQEMFGATDTPRIADDRVALTLHLLSPARRPVQVTRDLASFWKAGYFEVRKDLRGRYPKHYWPDDPLRAEATRRTRPRP
jgi:ATP-dependent helicase HrpB